MNPKGFIILLYYFFQHYFLELQCETMWFVLLRNISTCYTHDCRDSCATHYVAKRLDWPLCIALFYLINGIWINVRILAERSYGLQIITHDNYNTNYNLLVITKQQCQEIWLDVLIAIGVCERINVHMSTFLPRPKS